MLKSMTGFGRGEGSAGGCCVVCEIKTVNSKYLDINAKLPKSYSAFESKIKDVLSDSGVFRGKTDIWFEIRYGDGSSKTVSADVSLAKQYLEAMQLLSRELKLKDKVTLRDVVSRPDVLCVVEKDLPEEDFFAAAEQALRNAASQLVSMREAEGAKLYRDVSARIDTCNRLTEEIEELSEQSKNGYYSRLEEKLRAVLDDNRVTPDESRILTECAIFADKVSVDEETVRLKSHSEAFKALMLEDACGRRLDFLVQEMNREANTIGSKCSDSGIAHKIVALKNEIEKIREQIQNIE